MVPAGARDVEFRFQPASYRRGRWVSLVAIGAVGFFALAVLMRRLTASTGSRSSGH
jgi:hypothetical protein